MVKYRAKIIDYCGLYDKAYFFRNHNDMTCQSEACRIIYNNMREHNPKRYNIELKPRSFNGDLICVDTYTKYTDFIESTR